MELQTTTKLSKKTIANCLFRIQIDHSINIDIKTFDAKVDLLFEDCQIMTDEQFKSISENLRKSELYGKLPTSGAFLKFIDLVSQINQICGDNLVKATKESEGKTLIICPTPTARALIFELSQEKKDKIKSLFTNQNFEFIC